MLAKPTDTHLKIKGRFQEWVTYTLILYLGTIQTWGLYKDSCIFISFI